MLYRNLYLPAFSTFESWTTSFENHKDTKVWIKKFTCCKVWSRLRILLFSYLFLRPETLREYFLWVFENFNIYLSAFDLEVLFNVNISLSIILVLMGSYSIYGFHFHYYWWLTFQSHYDVSKSCFVKAPKGEGYLYEIYVKNKYFYICLFVSAALHITAVTEILGMPRFIALYWPSAGMIVL